MADLSELGTTGLRRSGGFINEEFLPQLSGSRAWRVYREMSDNDPIVGAFLFAIEKIIGQLMWRVDAGSEDPSDQAAALFIEEALEDMSDTFPETVSTILSMLVFGFSYHEIIYKKRGGDTGSAESQSRYSDGKIGWRKWSIRAQETLIRWEFDDEGGIQAFEQMDPSGGGLHIIPIGKALLFRTSVKKNNPEGRSILRNAYRSWHFKKRIEEIEAIGIERDLAGLPMALVPSKILGSNASPEDKQALSLITNIVQNVKRNQTEGLVFPSDRDDQGNLLYEFKLLSTGGTRNFDTDKIIARYSQQITMSVLADFLLLGHEQTGSYSLGVSKMDLWIMTVDSIAKSIASVINTHAIPKLLALNGMTYTKAPELNYGDVASVDLESLADYVQKLVAAGAILPDATLEDFLRETAKLPLSENPNRDYGFFPKIDPFEGGSDTETE